MIKWNVLRPLYVSIYQFNTLTHHNVARKKKKKIRKLSIYVGTLHNISPTVIHNPYRLNQQNIQRYYLVKYSSLHPIPKHMATEYWNNIHAHTRTCTKKKKNILNNIWLLWSRMEIKIRSLMHKHYYYSVFYLVWFLLVEFVLRFHWIPLLLNFILFFTVSLSSTDVIFTPR